MLSIREGSVADRPDTTELVDRGHFLGKENVHISGMLQKRRLFSSVELLDKFVHPMAESVRAKTPSLIIGQESSGGILAARIGERLAVPFIRLQKTAKTVGSLAARTERIVLVDDNFISGNNLQSVMETMGSSGMVPDAIVTLFDSSDEGCLAEFTNVPTEAVFSLGIKSWPPDSCELCEVYGEDSLGKNLVELELR